MTSLTFIEAVKAMIGLKPAMIEHLVTVALSLTDDERKQAYERLVPMHQDILRTNREIIQEIEKGEQDLVAFRKDQLPEFRREEEARERGNVEHILDDDSPSVS
jgi:hypothetical protein